MSAPEIIDPRICPKRPAEFWSTPPVGGGPQAHWFLNGRCHWCEVRENHVREDLRDWRYETLIARLTQALERVEAKL